MHGNSASMRASSPDASEKSGTTTPSSMGSSAFGRSVRSLKREVMILSDGMYVPALRWRQGEYQALRRLEDAVKDQVVP